MFSLRYSDLKIKTVGKETSKPRGFAGCYGKQIQASQSTCSKAFQASQWGARALRAFTQWCVSSAVFESRTGLWTRSGETWRLPTVSQTGVAVPCPHLPGGPHGAAPTPNGECAGATVPCPAGWPGGCRRGPSCGLHACHGSGLRCVGMGTGRNREAAQYYFSVFYIFQFALCELPIRVSILPSWPSPLNCGFVKKTK